MFTVTFFYAFAQQNGTLELIARNLVYSVRRIPWLIPIVIWIVTAVLAGIGPGSVAMFLCLAPLIMQIINETKVHPAARLCLSAPVWQRKKNSRWERPWERWTVS